MGRREGKAKAGVQKYRYGVGSLQRGVEQAMDTGRNRTGRAGYRLRASLEGLFLYFLSQSLDHCYALLLVFLFLSLSAVFSFETSPMFPMCNVFTKRDLLQCIRLGRHRAGGALFSHFPSRLEDGWMRWGCISSGEGSYRDHLHLLSIMGWLSEVFSTYIQLLHH